MMKSACENASQRSASPIHYRPCNVWEALHMTRHEHLHKNRHRALTATAPKLLSEAACLSHQVTANYPALELYKQDELGEKSPYLNIFSSEANTGLISRFKHCSEALPAQGP